MLVTVPCRPQRPGKLQATSAVRGGGRRESPSPRGAKAPSAPGSADHTVEPAQQSTLGANPSSEVTKLVCRLPSSTLTTAQPEITNLGDRMRFRVRTRHLLTGLHQLVRISTM